MTLLAQIAAERRDAVEGMRVETRERLRQYLRSRLPQSIEVVVFGSLVKPGKFSRQSDLDLALDGPADESFAEKLAIELEETFERPVEVLLLGRTRLRGAILRTGERWTS